MCQQCVNNGSLSQSTFDMIKDFLEKHPGAESGPAHIVLSDCNIKDGHIEYCIRLAKAVIGEKLQHGYAVG